MIETTGRFEGTFGKREQELAAIVLHDQQLLDSPGFTREEALRGVNDPGGYISDGLDLLLQYQWLEPVGGGRVRCTRTLRERARNAQERDANRK